MSEPYLLATRSLGKLYELRPMFAAAGLDVIDLDAAGIPESVAEEGLEEFETFEENALSKANYFHAKSGLVTIADDSGLEVNALDGAPGVRTKRWSGRTDLEGRALYAYLMSKSVVTVGALVLALALCRLRWRGLA